MRTAIFLPAFLVPCLLATASVAGQVFLDDPYLDDLPQLVSEVDVADVHGDGLVDLVLRLDDGQVGVRPGVGDGSFDPFEAVASPGTTFAVGDVDGNGRDDLLVGAGSEVRVFLAQAGGGFSEAAPVVVGGPLKALAVHDLDGDDVVDLALLTQPPLFFPGEVTWRPGQGDGSFGPATDLGEVGVSFSAHLLVGDVDGDGIADLVTATDVLVGLGGGDFEAPAPNGLDDLDDLLLADVDGDGADDLLARAFDVPLQDNVRVERLSGASVGNPAAAEVLAVDPLDGLAAADLDGDGRNDVLYASGGYELRALLQQPDGRLAPGGSTAAPGVSGAADLRLADVDHDGVLDLIALSQGMLSVLPGEGDGRFGPSRRFGPVDGEIWDSPRTMALGDLDGDADPELCAFVGDSTVWSQVGTQGGGFGPPQAFELGDMGEALFVGQLAGDPSGDLLGVDRTLGFRVFPGDGALGLLPVVETDPLWNVEQPLFADLDGDGLTDVVVRGPDPDAVSENAFAQTWTAQGDGNFALTDAARLGMPAPVDPYVEYGAWGLGHFDADERFDLVVAATDPPRIEVYRGRASGGFRVPAVTTVALPDDVIALWIGDVDGNARDDAALLLDGAGGPALSVLPGLGSWQLGAAVDSAALPGVDLHQLDLADLDRDGVLDAVVSGEAPGGPIFGLDGVVLVSRGLGDGSFVLGQTLAVSGAVRDQVLVDVDEDGAPDVVVMTPASEQVTVLRNTNGPWTDLGQGLAGATGVPSLRGYGPLLGGTEVTVSLRNALPSGAASFVLGVTELGAPFKGGVWVPTPTILLAGLPIDGEGRLEFAFPLPTGLPPDVPLYYQYWIPDPAGVAGFAASNALLSLTPGDV